MSPHDDVLKRYPLKALEAINRVLAIHEPADAAMYGGKNVYKVQVCTGCGQDDGNWNKWPCPTVEAIQKAVAA
jgi:hypothetical protein